MAKRKKKSLVKTKKKKRVSIFAPKLFLEQEIGESFVGSPKDLIGRHVDLNLMFITNDPKKRGVNVVFKINSVKNKGVGTEIIGYYLIPATVKRMVKRRKDRIDVYIKEHTKDGYEVILKPILITRSKTKGSILTDLRHKTEISLSKKVKSMKYEDLIKDIIDLKIQKGLQKELKKIYPLSVFQIRVLKLVGMKDNKEEKNFVEEIKEEKKEAVNEG